MLPCKNLGTFVQALAGVLVFGGVAVGVACAASYSVLSALTYRVVLTADDVEVIGTGFSTTGVPGFAAPSIHPTRVLYKHATAGRKSRTQYLTLAPWGPVQKTEDLSVSVARYRATPPGATVCIYLGAGALRIPWYQVRDCP